MVSGEAYSFESDIWLLGVLLYEMIALQPPFIAQNQL
jgi:serine/threonine protein kinase